MLNGALISSSGNYIAVNVGLCSGIKSVATSADDILSV
jgi:hypothetical protein